MPELTHKDKTFVRLKDNTIFSLSDVPPASTKRWVASRKLNVVRAVAYGLLEEGEAKKRDRLSDEEFISWVRDAANYGKEGLKVTLIKNIDKFSTRCNYFFVGNLWLTIIGNSIPRSQKTGDEDACTVGRR